MKRRVINENITLVSDLIDACEEKSYILVLYSDNAFNSVEYKFILNSCVVNGKNLSSKIWNKRYMFSKRKCHINQKEILKVIWNR